MGVRSVWLCISGLVAALLAVLTLVLFTGIDARAQVTGVESSGQKKAQSLKLAQSFYYPNYPQVKPKKRRYRRRYRRRAVKKCSSPWTYSRGLRRCICVAEGYGVS